MRSLGSFLKGSAAALALLLVVYAVSAKPVEQFGPKPDGHYDNHTYLVDPSRMDLGRVVASFVTLQTKTKFEALEGKTVEFQKEGSGMVLDGRFVLTVEHVVAQHDLDVNTLLGAIKFPVRRKISEETSFRWMGKEHRLLPIYKNREEDIALLEIPLGVSPPSFPYRIGDSDDLRVGNFLYVVGNPLSTGVNVREGIVSALRAPARAAEAGVKPEHVFMVSNSLMPGDSGSPIIAIRDGRFELVGISQGTVRGNTRLSWGIRINTIRNLLRAARAIPPDKWAVPMKAEAASDEIPDAAQGTGFLFRIGHRADRLLGDLISLQSFLRPSVIPPKQEKTP